MNKVLVTGATGYIGSMLVRRLIAEGREVHIILRPTSSLDGVSDLEDRLIVHVHDGTTQGLIDLVKVASPAVVFHLASLFLAQHAAEDVERLVTSNLLFSTQLAEAMMSNKVSRLINTGTSWQHYQGKAYNPVCLYAATKQAFEDVLEYYVQAQGLRVITLKLFDTYGPFDPRPKLFALLERSSKSSAPLDMSKGEQQIDMVFIDDVVEAYMLAGERLSQGVVQSHERFAVSSGQGISLREFVAVYEAVRGGKLPIRWGERPYRAREVMTLWRDFETLPGWSPKVGLREGIALVAKSYSKNDVTKV